MILSYKNLKKNIKRMIPQVRFISKPEAQSAYAYIKELEDYIENQEGEEDLKHIVKSLNKHRKLVKAINKLNILEEDLGSSKVTRLKA